MNTIPLNGEAIARGARQYVQVASRKRHVPFLLYGLLLFCAGLASFVFGVCLGLPRILLGASKLILVQEQIIWYSGVPVVLGIALALTDLLLFFDRKRFGTPVR